ncbi:MAG: c-type cytochrome [Gemmatimonadaceae bacterium]
MNKARLFALTTAVCLAACGSGKPAASDTAAAVPPPDSSPAVAPAPAVAESAVVAQTGKAAAPSKATVTTTKAAAAPVATPAPAAAKPAAVPVPAAQPAAQPAAKPTAPAPAVAVAPSAPRADPALGAPLYDANCRKCHGARGVASKVMQAKFPKMLPLDAAYLAKNTDAAVVDILMNGKGTNMKSFKDKLSHAEMGSVAAYIRTFAP